MINKFSVLICVYWKDNANIFNSALNSIFDNSIQPKEIILVVDGVIGDDIERVIQNHLNKRNLKVIRNTNNVGFVNSLNLGLKQITTDWVIRCDSDDINSADRFYILSQHMNDDVHIIGSYIAEVNENNKVYGIKKVPLLHEDIVKHFKKRNPFNHMSIAFKYSVVRDLGGYPNIELREDYALWALIVSKGYKSKNIDKILVNASAGEKMFKRRKGGSIISAEIALQSHLLKIGMTTPLEAFFYGTLRCISFMMPAFILKIIYNNVLRNQR